MLWVVGVGLIALGFHLWRAPRHPLDGTAPRKGGLNVDLSDAPNPPGPPPRLG